MPRKEINVMELRKQFVRDFKLEIRSFKDPCAMYGISRQTDCIPLRQTSCRLHFHADDPRRSDTTCKEINIRQGSKSRH